MALNGSSAWVLSLFLLLRFLYATAVCEAPDDAGRTTVVSSSFRSDGKEIKVDLLCGEDAAKSAARVATAKQTASDDGEAVLALAKSLEEKLADSDSGYQPPDLLDAGTPEERPRVLKTGGLYSRRATSHAKRNQHSESVADLLRALLRKNLDETARDKLMSTLADFLARIEKKRVKSKDDGDLAGIFEELELEDNGKDNSDIDRAALKNIYRKLSVKYHPDKNPEALSFFDQAAARFNRIRDAYELLSDPVKVLLYDTGGMELLKKYEGGGGDLDRTDNYETEVNVDLKDLYTGASRMISTHRRVVCRSCRLHPELPRCKACKACPGEVRHEQHWINQQQYTMREVHKPSDEKCIQDSERLSLSIERGMMAGDRISHPGMASQKPKHIPGDVLATIRVKKHPLFTRAGNDLMITIKVSLHEALLGFTRTLEHLDGHKITFGVSRGDVLKPRGGLVIDGEGMPVQEDPSSFGNLLVRFDIQFPDQVPADAENVLDDALRALGSKPLGATPEAVPRGKSEL